MRDIITQPPRKLRKPLLRAEIRRRALRAATAVAVGAFGGCGGIDEPVAGFVGADGTSYNDAHADGHSGGDGARTRRRYLARGAAGTPVGSDAGRVAMADAGGDVANDTGIADAGAADAGAGAAIDAAADTAKSAKTQLTSALSKKTCRPGDDWKAYQRCCQGSGWQAKGCMAWGPPAPPAMDATRLAELMTTAGEVMA